MAYNDAEDPGSQLDAYFMNAYLFNPGGSSGAPWIVVDDGKVNVVYNKDGWREGLKFLNRLYSKGLLAKESFTQTMEQFIRVGSNAAAPTIGVGKGGTWFTFSQMDDTKEFGRRWKDYVCRAAAEGAGWHADRELGLLRRHHGQTTSSSPRHARTQPWP